MSSTNHFKLDVIHHALPEQHDTNMMKSTRSDHDESFTGLHMDPNSSSSFRVPHMDPVSSSSFRIMHPHPASSPLMGANFYPNTSSSLRHYRSQRRTSSWKRLIDELVLITIPELREEMNRRDFLKSSSEKSKADEVDGFFTPEKEPFEEISYNCRPPPLFIPIVTITQICVFITYAVRLREIGFSRCCVDYQSPLVYDPLRRQQAWRFLSYCLLHSGIIHLLTNTFLQITLGIILELQHKLWRVLPVYLIGIVSGSLASSMFDPYVYLVGASGGVYALLGGHIATVILNWREMQYEWLGSVRNFLLSGVCRLVIVFFIILSDTAVAIYDRYASNDNARNRVSYAAHVGSFIAGLLVGVFFLRNVEMRRWKKIICAVSMIILGLVIVGGIVYNCVCSSYELCPS